MNAIRHPRDVENLFRSARALATVAAWTEQGLFAALAERPRPLSELPGDARALAVTLPIVMHLGLVMGDASRLCLTEPGEVLVRDGQLPGARMLESLGDLAQTGRILAEGGPATHDDGRSKATTGGVLPDDREASARFLDMLHESSGHSSRMVCEHLTPRLPEGARILDLGGGHGRYGRDLSEQGFSVTLFDQAMVCELARERHGDHLEYLEGDFLAGDDLGGPWDCVLLSNIVHGQSDEENSGLVKRLASRLAPGGILVLKDMFLDVEGRNPPPAVFFGLTMLFYTRTGASPELARTADWFDAAGLEAPEVIPLDRFTLVLGTRSA